LEEHTASIFRAEVSEAEKVADYIEAGGKKMSYGLQENLAHF
jgi:hypothetical protein